MPRRITLPLVLLAACGGPAPGPSAARPADAAAAVPAAAAPAVAGCRLRVSAAAAPALAAGLEAVAAQYFHAYHRGGFDAYRGGAPSFPWYDAHDLVDPEVPPRGVRVAASSRARLFVVPTDRLELGVLARGGGRTAPAVSWTGEKLYPEEAVDAPDGSTWLLGRTGSGYRVVRVDGAGKVTTTWDLGVGERFHDVRLALAADGTAAAAWLERDGGTLRIRLRVGERAPVTVDQVVLPEPVAALAERSRVELSVAAHGAHGLGIGWRPLVDVPGGDVGSPSDPPGTPAAAEVRWLVFDPTSGAAAPRRHPTVAAPLGFTTGVGPWGLSGNGMRAFTVAGHAVLVWIDGDAIRGVVADGDAPVATIAPAEGAPLLLPRAADAAGAGAGAVELLLLDSSPRVRAYTLACE